jgi:hypothetical protein
VESVSQVKGFQGAEQFHPFFRSSLEENSVFSGAVA